MRRGGGRGPGVQRPPGAARPGDVVILLGGRTGRDGIGGATGSSKSHNKASLDTMASEVQKGNAPEERKLQRSSATPTSPASSSGATTSAPAA